MSNPLEDNSQLARWDNESPNGGGVPAQYIDDGIGAFMLGAMFLFVWLMLGNRGKK